MSYVSDGWLPSSGELDAARAVTAKLRASDEPPWPDLRARLIGDGVHPKDVVVADQVSAGKHALSCLAISRTERVFAFGMIFGWDADGEPLPKGHARLGNWMEIPAERVRLTKDGIPNSWLRGVFVAHTVFDDEDAV